MTPHERMEDAGLLGGPLDDAGRAEWPLWAQEHFKGCAECQALARIDAAVAQVRRQGAEPPGFLTAELPPMAGTFRDAEGPLELRLTRHGLRALDPTARELAIFLVEPGQWPELLFQGTLPGEGLELPLAAAAHGDFVALASLAPLDADLWAVWIDERLSAGLPLGRPGRGVHLSRLTLERRLETGFLAVRDTPLPAPSAEVEAWLAQARSHGRDGRLRLATEAYRRATLEARALGDAAGEVRGWLGVANALSIQGYADEARAALAQVEQRFVVDRGLGAMILRLCAQSALELGRLDEAAERTRLAEEFAGPDPRHDVLRARIALGRQDWQGVIDTLEGSPVLSHPGLGEAMRALQQVGKVGLGAPVPPFVVAHDEHRELSLWRALVTAVGGTVEEIDRCVAELAPFFVEGADLQNPEELSLLNRVAHLSFARGALAAARVVLVWRFDLQGVSRPVRVVSGLDGGVLVLDPNGALFRAELGSDRLEDLARESAARALRPEGPDLGPLRALAEAIGAGDRLGVLASNLALSEAPFPALDGASSAEAFEVHVAEASHAPSGAAGIASIADSLGDLPWARDEVSSEHAALRFVGGAATRAALEELPELGLLHLGLHVERRGGVPGLVLADGFFSALDIEGLCLQGGPVVLLAGCASGELAQAVGVERSLARAFLRAKASAVVATRWPVEDGEMAAFVRAFVDRWGTLPLEEALRSAAQDLLRGGNPLRAWAAPVLYRSLRGGVQR